MEHGNWTEPALNNSEGIVAPIGIKASPRNTPVESYSLGTVGKSMADNWHLTLVWNSICVEYPLLPVIKVAN